MKNLLIITLLLTTLAACNTIEGLGKDVESAGEKIQDTSK